MTTRVASLAATTLLVVCVLCGGIGVAHATPVTLYDSYAAGDGHDSNGWEIGLGISLAMPFTPGIDAYLNRLTLSLSFGNGPNEVDIAILADASGLPGAVLESFHLVAAIPTGPYPPIVLSSVLNPLLISGTPYWVSAHANPASSDVGWFWTTGRQTGPHAAIRGHVGGTDWEAVDNEITVFRVEGSPVPEPMTVSLLGAGTVALGLKKRRRTS